MTFIMIVASTFIKTVFLVQLAVVHGMSGYNTLEKTLEYNNSEKYDDFPRFTHTRGYLL